jgi:tetratricopeptide (TPR) repeat protein
LARLTRQELKKDEFAERLETIQEFFLHNQKEIVKFGGIAVLIAAVAIGGLFLYRSRQNKASSAFAQALVSFHAPVMPSAPPGTTQLTFKSDAEKYQQALKQFSEVAGSYSWSAQGRYARYYVGLCQRALGNNTEAEKELKASSEGRDTELAALAKFALGGLYEQTGRTDQAEKIYRDLQSHPAATVPKATVELALADLYQKIKPTEAGALYQQIQKEYPGLAAGDAASKMLEDGAK